MTPSAPLGPYRILTLPQGTIRYREAGSGPPIVFLHGFLVNGDLWRRVVPLLSSTYRCIVPDLPLGGQIPAMPDSADLSPPGQARIVRDFLAALALNDVSLVGSDTGGAIAQLVIAHHPERIGRLVLTNCDAYRHFPPPLILPFKWAGFVPGFIAGSAHVLRFVPLSRRAIYALVARHDPGKSVLSAYFSPLITDSDVRRDVGKVLRSVSARHTMEAARAFPRTHQPVLIVWGDKDFLFLTKDAHRLANDFPNARLEFVAGSRAFVAEDQPEVLADFIAGFLAEHAAVAP